MIRPAFVFNGHSATARITAAVFVVAVTTFVAICAFGKQIDDRRLEQLQVARIETQIARVVGDMDGLSIGEDVDDFQEDVRLMNLTVNSITDNGGRTSRLPLHEAYREFTLSVKKQWAAIAAGDMSKARQIDTAATDPAFDRLDREMTNLNVRLESEASIWVVLIQATTALSMLGGALTVTRLLIRYREQVESTVVLELRQQSASAGERRLKSLIQNSSDVIVLVSGDGTVTMVSDACERAWGQTADALVGKSVFDLIETEDASRIRRLFDESVLVDTAQIASEGKVVCSDGGVKEFELHFANLLDDPDVSGVLLTFHDLTERKKFEQELAHHAFHDRLTALPNRALFLDRLTHRLKAREIDGNNFAVLFIDLDNFKVINDSLGHDAGDKLLIEVAARLQSVVRPVDTVARMGGDEFTIILDEAANADEAVEVGERILKALVTPLSLGDREIFVTSSIGVVMASDSTLDAAGLLRDADTAMYEAKGNGKAGVTVFEASMNLHAVDRMELESDLRVAIENEQFFLAYQPIVDMDTGRLRDVEALIRWQHPVRGVVAPLSFIPLAEETGLICAIGRWALREGCGQLARWNEGLQGEDRLRISVNVSARQVQEKGYIAEILATVTEFGIEPRLVELEVTETAMLNDLVKMKGVFDELRKIGFRIAIDDFGTGYSSMAYLSHLPVDTLKIDRSFVIPLGEDDRAIGVVQAMITMAHTLGLGITGEGVETHEQLKSLQVMGCDLGQGFLFDRPMTPESVTQLLGRPEKSPFFDSLATAA